MSQHPQHPPGRQHEQLLIKHYPQLIKQGKQHPQQQHIGITIHINIPITPNTTPTIIL